MSIRTERGSARRWLDDILAKEDHGDDCLIWPFRIKNNGYGQIGNYYGKQYPHRLVCIAFHGEPPFEKAEAAHSCNKRACCNPRHLRWATHSENQRDRHEHGTAPIGSRASGNKLTAEQVVQVRVLYRAGDYTHAHLAEMFGVSPANIGSITTGRTWRWLRA